jgi:uncharacterized protein YndB with AHSA1/START domain
MVIERSIEIARDPQAVFDFVADPRNDPLWCPKLVSVEPVDATGTGPGARFDVVHRPIPLRPARTMRHVLVDWDPPHRIDWREEDGDDLFLVTYRLEAGGGGTRFTQRDDVRLSLPRFLHPAMRKGIGADMAKQLRHLRSHLEAGQGPG